jgi:hypothetical protein
MLGMRRLSLFFSEKPPLHPFRDLAADLLQFTDHEVAQIDRGSKVEPNALGSRRLGGQTGMTLFGAKQLQSKRSYDF